MSEEAEFTATLPPADGVPGCSMAWPEDCQAATDKGTAFAEQWLNDSGSGWLWSPLFIGLELQTTEFQRVAFEVGFLVRIHQRLCSPLGGNHRARKARFWR